MVDLDGTDPEGHHIPPYTSDNSENDSVFCKTEGGKFIKHGDVSKLESIIDHLRAWATSQAASDGRVT